MFAAPCAAGIGAGTVPQAAHQGAGFRELVANPRRHDRIAPGHRQPRQRVGQRPATVCRRPCVRSDFCVAARRVHCCSGVRGTDSARNQPANGGLGVGFAGTGHPSNRSKEGVEPGVTGIAPPSAGQCGQPVPGDESVRTRTVQRLSLVVKQLECKARVKFRVIALPPHQTAVLVVLDQVMVGMGGKGQWTQAQCVYYR